MIFSKTILLLVIDVQKGFDDPRLGQRNNPDAEHNIQRLIALWRIKGHPIIFIQHASRLSSSPFHPSKTGFAIKAEVAPRGNEPVIVKNENSAFIGTDLEQRLKHFQPTAIQQIMVVGLTTDHCVSTTVRMGANLGFSMGIVSDATATFDRLDHTGVLHLAHDVQAIHLASLHNEFATIWTTKHIELTDIHSQSQQHALDSVS